MNNFDTAKAIRRILEFREARDWKQFHKPKDMLLSLLLEASELAELSQWISDEDFERKLPELREQLGDELADVLYWVLLIAEDFGVDLEQSFHKKMDKNESKYPIDQAKGRSEKYNQL